MIKNLSLAGAGDSVVIESLARCSRVTMLALHDIGVGASSKLTILGKGKVSKTIRCSSGGIIFAIRRSVADLIDIE